MTDPAKLFSLLSAAPSSASVSSAAGAPPITLDNCELNCVAVIFSAASDDAVAMDAEVALSAVAMVAADADSPDARDAAAVIRVLISDAMLALMTA